jgi:hypothetical protein
VLLAFAPFAVLTWAGFALAARRARRRAWWIAAAAWAVLGASPWVLDALLAETEANSDRLGLLGFAIWFGGVAHAVTVRPGWIAEVSGLVPEGPGRAAALRRIAEREWAQRLARDEPLVALELGVGRPDRRGVRHGGVVDVNHAPRRVLTRVPGVDRALADRIVAVRGEVGGFSSANDLATVLDLPPDVVDDVARHTVYLPRR